MSDIKLYYFGFRARAEAIRLTLVAAGHKFEDVRLTREQWAQQKAKSPYGQMPYIEYKGQTFGDSKAIAAFVARECGLAGKTSVDAMRVDEVFCLVSTLLDAMAKVHYETDQAKKAEMQKELDDVTIPKFMGFFEKMLKDNGSCGYIVGNALTQADLSVYDITCSLIMPRLLDSFPELQKMRKNVEANTKVKAYLDSRPDTEY